MPEKYLPYLPWMILIIRELMHWIERRDLYSRIMADSLPEYENMKGRPRTKRVKYNNPIRKNMLEHQENILKREG
ncbi:MAG TPA: hypothetical protein PK684_03800 [Bacillota bacterium]|jgi:hypothetical protein|nr:hypothetical protein [Bacillota bacterium]